MSMKGHFLLERQLAKVGKMFENDFGRRNLHFGRKFDFLFSLLTYFGALNANL